MSKAAVQRGSCKVGKIVEKYFLRSSFWVKLQAECCNFTKSEPLHRYFSRILATFLEIIAIFYFSLSLFISPYTSISTAMSPLALHYFEHNFHSYLSLSLFISKWEPTLRSINLQVPSHFSNMLIKSKSWHTQWWTVIQEQWFEKWFPNSTLSRQMQMNSISFIYQGMLLYWKVRAINNLIDSRSNKSNE